MAVGALATRVPHRAQMTGSTLSKPGMIKRNIRPGIDEVTVGTFSTPMPCWFGMARTAIVIQRVIVTYGIPISRILVTGITGARIMIVIDLMAGSAICHPKMIVIDFLPDCRIMTILTYPRIMIGRHIMAARTECQC